MVLPRRSGFSVVSVLVSIVVAILAVVFFVVFVVVVVVVVILVSAVAVTVITPVLIRSAFDLFRRADTAKAALFEMRRNTSKQSHVLSLVLRFFYLRLLFMQ